MEDKISTIIKIKNYVFSIIAIILFVIGLSFIINDYTLEQKAINTTAKILTINYEGRNYVAEVEYKAGRETIKKMIYLENEDLAVNDTIPIKYDKNNPNKLIENNHLILIIIFIAASIIFSILGLFKTIKSIKKDSQIKKIKNSGLYIMAPITEIYINNIEKPVLGKYPYKLRSKFINPNDNKEYVFESDNTFINLQDVINKYHNTTIKIFIDRENSSNYYVDYSSLFPEIKIVSPKDLMNPQPEPTPTEEQTSSEESNTQTSDETKQSELNNNQ